MATTLKALDKSVTLNAPKEKVWQVLLDDKYVRDWYRAFSEGAYADTDWKEGSKVVFKDDTGCGLIGRVVTNKPYEEVIVEYDGVLVNGNEDYDSAMAVDVRGGQERYRLSTRGSQTVLDVEGDMTEEMYSMLSSSWDKALVRFKELAEAV